MIDQLDAEVLQWAASLVNAKRMAEAATASGNQSGLLEWRGYADTARNKLQSLGFGWVAAALSADGANAAQAAQYVQALQRHLAAWAGPAIQTPSLSLRDGLDGRIYQVSGAQVTATSGTSWGGQVGGIASNVLGGLGQGLGAGITAASAPARAEADQWLGVGQKAVAVFMIPLGIWAAVRILPGAFRALRGR